jgi:hypothetical protein
MKGKPITMSTTTPTTDTTHDVTRAQLENALHALRHALRATTPLIGAVEDGHLAAHIATAAGQVAEAARSVAACIDVVDGYTHINDVIR